jgi:hypothetical protein
MPCEDILVIFYNPNVAVDHHSALTGFKMILLHVLQGSYEDIPDSWEESGWFWYITSTSTILLLVYLTPKVGLLVVWPPYLTAMHPPFKAVCRYIFSKLSFYAAEQVFEAVKMICTQFWNDSNASSIPLFLALEGFVSLTALNMVLEAGERKNCPAIVVHHVELWAFIPFMMLTQSDLSRLEILVRT